MMLEGVPNLALAIGYTNASWTLRCDLTCRYVTRLLNHLRDTSMRQCTPVNDDPDVGPEPLLNLRSGYIQRAQGKMPQQGSQQPWRVYQSYLPDYPATPRAHVDAGGVRCGTPAPAATPMGPGVAGR